MTFQIFSFINNLPISSQNPAQVVAAPNHPLHNQVVSVNSIVSEQNQQFANILNNVINNTSCPIPAKPITILLNPQNQTVIVPKLTYPNYRIGNYYKIPVSSQFGENGSILPQYYANIPAPYFGFVYPVGDVNHGYVLVKTLSPFLNPPQDVTIFNETEVLSELQRLITTIFAM